MHTRTRASTCSNVVLHSTLLAGHAQFAGVMPATLLGVVCSILLWTVWHHEAHRVRSIWDSDRMEPYVVEKRDIWDQSDAVIDSLGDFLS